MFHSSSCSLYTSICQHGFRVKDLLGDVSFTIYLPRIQQEFIKNQRIQRRTSSLKCPGIYLLRGPELICLSKMGPTGFKLKKLKTTG